MRLTKASLVLSAALMLGTMSAQAGELLVHLGSTHHPSLTSEGQPYNNRNPGIGYKSDSQWLFGAYHNSYRKTTVYAGRVWEWPVGPVRAGVVAFLATGYQDVTGKWASPLGAATLYVPLSNKVGLRFMAIPRVNSETSTVAHVALSFKSD